MIAANDARAPFYGCAIIPSRIVERTGGYTSSHVTHYELVKKTC